MPTNIKTSQQVRENLGKETINEVITRRDCSTGMGGGGMCNERDSGSKIQLGDATAYFYYAGQLRQTNNLHVPVTISYAEWT